MRVCRTACRQDVGGRNTPLADLGLDRVVQLHEIHAVATQPLEAADQAFLDLAWMSSSLVGSRRTLVET